MNNKFTFLALAIICFGIGVGSMFSSSSLANVMQGVGKGFGLVFFIIFFVRLLIGNQPLDKMPH